MAELSKKADIADAYIAQLETGKKNNPSFWMPSSRLARALGVPVGSCWNDCHREERQV